MQHAIPQKAACKAGFRRAGQCNCNISAISMGRRRPQPMEKEMARKSKKRAVWRQVYPADSNNVPSWRASGWSWTLSAAECIGTLIGVLLWSAMKAAISQRIP